MKPLNLRNYILIRMKQVSPQIILLIIKIALFTFLCSIGFAVSYGLDKSSNMILDNYASFSFKNDVQEDRRNELLNEIRMSEGIEKEFRGSITSEGMGKLIIFNSFAWIFEIDNENISYVLNSIDGKLIDGIYPQRENEILISNELSKGMNKSVGDTIGQEQMLPKRYIITGIYEGGSNTFISYNPTPNDYIFKIEKKNIDQFYQNFKTYDEIIINTYRDEIYNIMDNIFYLLKIVGIIILIITAFEVTISVSNLNKVYFTERLGEFAILQAIGYSRRFILTRMLKELSIIILIGLIGGTLLGQLIMTLFYYLYCVDNGIPYRIFEPGVIYFSIFLSVIIFLLTYLPIKKYIAKMEWLDVIQQNNA
ncbi:FtsX-like permease family protein [Mycoplasmatota bacterium]|nr:FtsX-like permease family protein [Mycoplasmatota bacterium]